VSVLCEYAGVGEGCVSVNERAGGRERFSITECHEFICIKNCCN
jgi:hypothetical protein